MSDALIQFRDDFELLRSNVETFIKGKSDVVRMALVCMFGGGHLLIEDVPGVAKTSLAKAIAESIDGGELRRIQFTPDLLPSDITGVEVFDPDGRNFRLRRGPVFANIVLGDEINRAAPRTQSALLQVMAERQVTIGLTTHRVPAPFFCVATQNPYDHRGTYPLPEAQLDRFLMRISVGYPALAEEMRVISQGVTGRGTESLSSVITIDRVAAMIEMVRSVHVSEALTRYIAQITWSTRSHPSLRLGISPRGSIALASAAMSHAAASGRSFAAPDDVKAVAGPVLEHRLVLTQDALMRDEAPDKITREVVDNVEVPSRP
jgi:MoxR-like ATPase